MLPYDPGYGSLMLLSLSLLLEPWYVAVDVAAVLKRFLRGFWYKIYCGFASGELVKICEPVCVVRFASQGSCAGVAIAVQE